MAIYVENLSEKIKYKDLRRGMFSVRMQVKRDFARFWGQCDLVSYRNPDHDFRLDPDNDAIVYIGDKVDVKGVLEYHKHNDYNVPFGVVYTKLCDQVGEHWSVALSREVLGLLADPHANLLAIGPHPRHSTRSVLHWRNLCSAVQGQTYKIDGIDVANFLLPGYFNREDLHKKNTNFLGTPLDSFGVATGGYIGFYDFTLHRVDIYSKGVMAAKRRRIEQAADIHISQYVKHLRVAFQVG